MDNVCSRPRFHEVTVTGTPNLTRQFLGAGLADELHIDAMPVLLAAGQRPFEGVGPRSARLERAKAVAAGGGRTHIEFSILK